MATLPPEHHHTVRTDRTVTLALVQMRCTAAKDENVRKGLQRIAEAATAGANVVCLPELFAGLYPCQSEDYARFSEAEPIPGPTTAVLAETAREYGVVVLTSIFEHRAAGIYHNTAVVIDADGRLAGIYRKMHIPDDPLFMEKFYFTPGDTGFCSFKTRFGRIGVCVCWDQWFPEAARLTALSGAEVIFYPTAIGWLDGQTPPYRASQHTAWETVMRGHAVANGLFVAAVNRIGTEAGIEFWGASFACDPFGNVLAKASHDTEETLLIEADLGGLDSIRTQWPFFRDRRIDAYGDLTRRFLDPS
jgi:N-carbamoylputrescine amidase